MVWVDFGPPIFFGLILRCFFVALLRDSFGACSGMVRKKEGNGPERTRGWMGDGAACVANFRNVGRMGPGRKVGFLNQD